MNRPNVLVIFTDDQRYDTIAALGNTTIRTPNLDRLVARGVAFTQAHIPSGMHGAVCMPSRAMLHTGRSLYRLGGTGSPIDPGHAMIGETLQEAGYECFGTGKWHNSPESYARSFTTGAEIMFGGMADHWNVPMCAFDPTGRYDHAQPAVHNPYGDNRVVTHVVDHITPGAHSTELITNATLDYLDRAPAHSPFFAYVSYLAPHDPRTMPRRFLEMYDPAEIDLPESYRPEHPFDYGMRDVRDELLEAYPRTPEAIRRHLAEYYAMITHLDDAVGRILDRLEERGLAERTIVVFAGDNGLALGRHGLMGKQSTYDHSVRVPLIFAGPGIPAGRTTDAFAYLFDVYPTLCDLLELQTPPTVEGRSLVPIFADTNAHHRDELYFGFGVQMRAAKTRSHKLMLSTHREQNWVQLFDLELDPDEIRNIAGLPEIALIQTDLTTRLMRLRDEWGDRETEWGEAFWRRFEANGGLRAAQIVR